MSRFTFALLALLALACIATAAPLDALVRHNGIDHSADAASSPEETMASMEEEGTGDEGNNAEKEEGDKPSHAGHNAEKEDGDKPSHEGHNADKEDGDKPSDGSHEGHNASKEDGEKPSGETQEGQNAPGNKPAAGTITTAEASTGASTSEEPEASPLVEDGVCIAAEMLGGFASHELVFEKHVLARVLCDATGSCATRGHMVHFNGAPMMMGTYCGLVGCETRAMRVNSPRYARGLRLQSKSEGLTFTALAARFETRGEEAVLATAVRMGL